MNRLIRAEVLKLRTTRAAFWTWSGSLRRWPSGFRPASPAPAAPAGLLPLPSRVRNVLGELSSGAIIALILGILAMSDGYRHTRS